MQFPFLLYVTYFFASFEYLYVMGLRPLWYVYSSNAGSNSRRQIRTSKVDPHVVRVEMQWWDVEGQLVNDKRWRRGSKWWRRSPKGQWKVPKSQTTAYMKPITTCLCFGIIWAAMLFFRLLLKQFGISSIVKLDMRIYLYSLWSLLSQLCFL